MKKLLAEYQLKNYFEKNISKEYIHLIYLFHVKSKTKIQW